MSTTLTIAVLYEALKKQLGFEWITGEELGDHTIQTAADATGEVSLVAEIPASESNSGAGAAGGEPVGTTR